MKSLLAFLSLAERFPAFRIDHDPAYAAEHGERGRADDPCLQQIPCAFGHIYQHSATRLGFASNTRGHIARQVASITGALVEQEGDDGLNISFPMEEARRVFGIVKAKRKRKLSPERREALVAIGRENLRKLREAKANDAQTPLDSLRTPSAVLSGAEG